MDESLVEHVREIIRSRIALDEKSFDDLCIALAKEQGLFREEDSAQGLRGIEPLHEAAFKLMTVAQFPPSETTAEFWTSGTTRGAKGKHIVKDLDLYRLSVLRGFETFVMYPPRPRYFLSLIPTAQDRPHSSLSWMITFVMEAYAEIAPPVVRIGDRLDMGAIKDFLVNIARLAEPVVLLGTTLDFMTLFEAMGSTRIPLPEGSRAMHTGGSKASGRTIERTTLWANFEQVFAVPADDVIEEYGMTELFSQAYDSPRVTTGPRRFVTVPWMRTRVVSPLNLDDVAEGERGLLCHYDLANAWTAVAILTSDVATRVADGFADVERVPGSPQRGCSQEAVRTV